MKIYDVDLAIEMKMMQFETRGINVTRNDIKKFLKKIYLVHRMDGRHTLTNFVKEDNISDIVSFLMSEAIINPKIKYNGKK